MPTSRYHQLTNWTPKDKLSLQPDALTSGHLDIIPHWAQVNVGIADRGNGQYATVAWTDDDQSPRLLDLLDEEDWWGIDNELLYRPIEVSSTYTRDEINYP